MIQEKLNQLNLPELLTFNNGSSVKNADDWAVRREEILHIMCGQVYGFAPPPPEKVKAEVIEQNEKFFAGKAVHSTIIISFNTDNGIFSFPVNLLVPKGINKPPLILHIAFRPDIPDKYFPAEEVLDNGFAVAAFCYNDITLDKNDDFSSGLAKMYERTCNTWGKIAMWAWSASRVMDYLQTLEEIDKDNIAVMGHSRLGKTALLAGALDKRFTFVISNDSGCSGAAITRNKTGQHIKEIYNTFGYWFCENYKKYIDNENAMPFDQHFLLSAVAPRALYVASAKEDTWADPYSEYLCCASVDCVYKLFDKDGFIHPNRYPAPGDVFAEGNVGYHLRAHEHFLSRYDWQRFMDFILRHKNIMEEKQI